MTRDPRCGRAVALLLTGLVLVATSIALPTPLTFDAATSCGPAGRVELRDPPTGCGGDPSWQVVGGPEAGLPPFAEALHPNTSGADQERWVLAGPVVLPGSVPPVTVRRVCRVGPLVGGARAIACEGEVPEAACEGTLTAVVTAARVAP